MKLDPKRQADAGRRALEFREEAHDLIARANALKAKAAAIERTWSFAPMWNPDVDIHPDDQ